MDGCLLPLHENSFMDLDEIWFRYLRLKSRAAVTILRNSRRFVLTQIPREEISSVCVSPCLLIKRRQHICFSDATLFW